MILRVILLLTALMAGFGNAALAAGDEAQFRNALAKNRYLEAELSLAQKNKFYVVFDFDRKEVLLKARGAEFRSWPLASFQQFGKDVPVEVIALEKRTYETGSLRVVIKPPEPEKNEEEKEKEEKVAKAKKPASQAEQKKAEPEQKKTQTAPALDAMEVAQMPAEYSLYFQKGIVVMVSPVEKGVGEGLRQKYDRLVRKVKETYKLYKLKSDTTQGTVFYLKMAEGDAKALYWALGDSVNVIFWANP